MHEARLVKLRRQTLSAPDPNLKRSLPPCLAMPKAAPTLPSGCQVGGGRPAADPKAAVSC